MMFLLLAPSRWRHGRSRRAKKLRHVIGCRASAPAVDAPPVMVVEEQADTSERREVGPAVPWLQRHVPRRAGTVSQDELLICFLEAMEERGVDLYPAQEEAIVEIFGGAHVVLDTPTGSGKSLVAVAALFKALSEGGRAIYTAPTKALVSEKFFDLCRLFSPKFVGMATGDVSINNRAPLLVCTAEILTSIALREGRSARLDHVIMDEFHYYGDASRGAAWEIPLWRLPHASFLLMSGTLGANPRLYQSIQAHTGRPLRVVSSSVRPVPLRFSYAAATEHAAIAQLVADGRFPVYAVHFSQREAVAAAHVFADDPSLRPSAEHSLKLREAVAKLDFGSPFGAELRDLVLCGIGVHHGGLLPRYRRFIETLAQQSLLTVVCGTDTLGVGVNVPIRSVLFSRLCKYDGRHTRHLHSREFHQIAGRAGRRGFDDTGDVVALEPEWQVLNEELRQRRLSGADKSPPRWQRPPTRNYKHWGKSTFDGLQRRPPDALRSRFELSLGWVLELCLGAWQRGGDADCELRELVQCAQCSRSERFYWLRQARAFSRAVQRLGFDPSAGGGAAEDLAAQRVAHGDMPGGEAVQASQRHVSASFADDATPFLVHVLPALEEQFDEADFPLAVLAAVEAICPAPPALMRCIGGARQRSIPARGSSRRGDGQEAEDFGVCPRVLEDILFQQFYAHRAQNPWVTKDAVQPKGIALHMFMDGLSFAAATAKLGGTLGPAVTEGPLLRYLNDLYRTLQRGTPDSSKPASIHQVEAFLRSTIESVDSSLIAEYDLLRALERAQGTAATLSDPASDGQSDSGVGPDRGALVPAAPSASQSDPTQCRPGRTRRCIEEHVQQLRLDMASRRKSEEADRLLRERRLSARVSRWLSNTADVLTGAASAALSSIW